MKNLKTLSVILTFALISSLAHAQRDGWKLVWSDEFNIDGHPDESKWIYEHGYIRNHEGQYYTKKRLENSRVENGKLILEARMESFKNES